MRSGREDITSTPSLLTKLATRPPKMDFIPASPPNLPVRRKGPDMKSSKALLILAAAWSLGSAANLQPQDVLFIGVHRNPTQVASDDKVAYVLTEGGVLMYDYRRTQWVDNIAPGMGVNNIAYNSSKNQLLMA